MWLGCIKKFKLIDRLVKTKLKTKLLKNMEVTLERYPEKKVKYNDSCMPLGVIYCCKRCDAVGREAPWNADTGCFRDGGGFCFPPANVYTTAKKKIHPNSYHKKMKLKKGCRPTRLWQLLPNTWSSVQLSRSKWGNIGILVTLASFVKTYTRAVSSNK